MNLGQQMVIPELAGNIDEATRERLIAEHLASNLHNDSLSAALVNAGFIPAGTFMNLSAPGAVVNHTINLLRAPVATLAQTIGLQNTAAVASHHIGLKGTAAPHPNGLQSLNVGINHSPGLNGLSNPHQYITGISGVGINMGPKAPGVNINRHVNPAIGTKAPGTGMGSSTTHTESPGPSLSHNLGSRVAMSTGTQNMMPRIAGANMAHSGLLRNGAWQGAIPSMGIQMGSSQASVPHLNATSGYQRISAQGVTGYVQQKHKLLGPTFLDEFKQGFPTKGLSVFQNRWWGNAESSRYTEVVKGTELSASNCPASSEMGGKSSKYDTSKCSVGASGDNVAAEKTKEILVSFARITRLRKKAVERGRSSLQLAVSRGYGVQKLEHHQYKTLEFAFGSKLPRQWSSALTTCD